MVIENIKQAAADGGAMLSRVKAIGFLYNESGNVNGVKAQDLLTDEIFDIHANLVINTSGPWVDKVRELDQSKKSLHKFDQQKGFI